ncbi:MAG: DUF72 domain-containing protein [Anaerolineales bacterium]
MNYQHENTPGKAGNKREVPHPDENRAVKALIGTSGWQYPDFSDRFYPDKLEKSQQLGYYADQFPAVEVNNTFYQLPTQETIEKWLQSAPDDFIFAVKASRYITHMKNLLDPEDTLPEFYKRIASFGDQCGPILLQLPPRWKVNLERLKNFLPHLSGEFRHAIEFRNKSWLTDEVYELIRRYNVAFCIYDFNYHQSPRLVTTDFVYVRLHGPGQAYHDPYDLDSLQHWARRILSWCCKDYAVYCFFDNTFRGYAWENAQTLLSSLRKLLNSR